MLVKMLGNQEVM